MSAATIIKNVFQFAQILNNSASEDVKQWDRNSLKNSMKWAEYSQEVYKHVKDQPYEKDVETQLQAMTVLLEPASCLRLTVDSLGQAKYLLIKSLLSNLDLTQDLHEDLNKLLMEDPESSRLLEHFQKELEVSQIHANVSKVLYRIFGGEGGDVELEEKQVRWESRSVLEHLVITMKDNHKNHRFEKYCLSLFDRLTQNGGLDILLALYLEQCDEDINTSEYTTVRESLHSWLSSRVGEDDSVQEYLLSYAKPGILLCAAQQNEKFLHLYLGVLSDWADSFLPCVEKDQSVQWRSPSGSTLADLTSHFESLLLSLCSSAMTKSIIIKVITDRVRSNDFSVWQPLSQNLLHSLTNACFT